LILIDTNVLIALTDPRESDYAPSIDELKSIREPILLPSVVLCEACYFLTDPFQRAQLRRTIATLGITVCPIPDEAEFWQEVFAWFDKYSEHSPDAVDAFLVILSHRNRRLKVWTHDSEFWTIWRRPDGSRVPLAVKPH
jgi:predicted nucleic acid-binding protein